ncbi:unnamed protein product, partial [Amoebophrya sp. A120]
EQSCIPLGKKKTSQTTGAGTLNIVEARGGLGGFSQHSGGAGAGSLGPVRPDAPAQTSWGERLAGAGRAPVSDAFGAASLPMKEPPRVRQEVRPREGGEEARKAMQHQAGAFPSGRRRARRRAPFITGRGPFVIMVS